MDERVLLLKAADEAVRDRRRTEVQQEECFEEQAVRKRKLRALTTSWPIHLQPAGPLANMENSVSATLVLTNADHQPLPTTYCAEPRYIGYSETELTSPYAGFFRPTPAPIQPQAIQGLLAGAQPSPWAYELSDAAARLSRAGYEPMETGWARTPRGTLMVACLTSMPRVSAPMWDWWFGWHSRETARYKLWHPGAHVYSSIGEDRSHMRTLSDRQRYIDNVSIVDEYIGDVLQRLAIRFVDPRSIGFEDRPGTTCICARVGASDIPVTAGWLIHQVRPTEDGAEMRSRFFLGHPQILSLPVHAFSNRQAATLLTSRPGRLLLRPALRHRARRMTDDDSGRALLQHCATEMNHLALILPELYAAFRGTP